MRFGHLCKFKVIEREMVLPREKIELLYFLIGGCQLCFPIGGVICELPHGHSISFYLWKTWIADVSLT